jgi:hypothetical protein
VEAEEEGTSESDDDDNESSETDESSEGDNDEPGEAHGSTSTQTANSGGFELLLSTQNMIAALNRSVPAEQVEDNRQLTT